MKTAICPGSFDPITNGHMDVIERAAGIFDRTIVVVMQNRRKSCLFSVEERMNMIRASTKHLYGVEVETSDKLLVDYCRDKGRAVIVRGLRAVSDFEHEFQMALANRHMNPEVDTMFFAASESHQYLSSSLIKEISSYGGDISTFVPPQILRDVLRRFESSTLQG